MVPESNTSFPRIHVAPPIREEVNNPPAGGLGHAQLGELVLQHNQGDGDEVQKTVLTKVSDIQVLEDSMSSVGEPRVVQEREMWNKVVK